MSERVDPNAVYSEEQPFLPVIVGALMPFGALIAFAFVMYVVTTSKELPRVLIPIMSVVLTIDVIYSIVLALSKRTIEVRNECLVLRARPLAFLLNRRIAFDQIAQIEMQAPRSVRVRLVSGQSVTITSRKPDELAAAIQGKMPK